MSEAKTHVIDGKTYVEVERKANVGEKVVAVKYIGQSTKPGDILTCVCNDEYDDGSIDAETSDGYVKFFDSDIDEYRVLVPQESAPESIADIIANLVRRVAALESQLRDTQNNVERQGVEIAKSAHNISGLEKSLSKTKSDVDTLTQKQRQDYVSIKRISESVAAPQSGAKLLADAFEALAKYERSVGR